jgi:hypothetical protein
MLTWHLFTNDQTVLFEQSGQTVLLQTQCLISEPVDKIHPKIVYTCFNGPQILETHPCPHSQYTAALCVDIDWFDWQCLCAPADYVL